MVGLIRNNTIDRTLLSPEPGKGRAKSRRRSHEDHAARNARPGTERKSAFQRWLWQVAAILMSGRPEDANSLDKVVVLHLGLLFYTSFGTDM
jgi:hypothetical protein